MQAIAERQLPVAVECVCGDICTDELYEKLESNGTLEKVGVLVDSPCYRQY